MFMFNSVYLKTNHFVAILNLEKMWILSNSHLDFLLCFEIDWLVYCPKQFLFFFLFN